MRKRREKKVMQYRKTQVKRRQKEGEQQKEKGAFDAPNRPPLRDGEGGSSSEEEEVVENR